MAKIYVSSTYIDLQEYRTQVEKVIRRMGHTDMAMEYYVADDMRPVTRCLADVANCDVYIGIYAWRYGWQPNDNNPDQLSITEMEFRQAEKMGKPCLIFLLSDDAPWPRKHMDKDITKIDALRNSASTKHTADWFATSDELARKIAEAIYKQIPAVVSIPEHNLNSYYEALRKRYGVLALEGLTPPQKEEYLKIQLRSVFVEQSVRENPPPIELPKDVWEKLSRDKEIHVEDLPSSVTLVDVLKVRESYYDKPSRPVLDVLIDPRHQYTIILGDPGSGKSTLARYVMLSLIESSVDEKLKSIFDHYLPLLIELRSYAGLSEDGTCKTFLEFLDYLSKTEGWALTPAELHSHLKQDGKTLVIFDGLDEIFDPEQRERITRQIVGFCNDYPKARAIVTSRTLGYRRKILTDASFLHFTLQDLDKKQVEAFVTQWYNLAMSDRPDEAKERCDRILKSFKNSASIRQLAGNPMLLTIMSIIGKHQELPRERWKLYDHAASVLIQHWDVNKHLKDKSIDANFIGEDDKKELLRRLAFRMQRGDGGLSGNYIHRDELQEEFQNYLKERYNQRPDQAKIVAEAMLQQFRERNFILSLYGANLYGFVHRAFLEYFCASALVWKFEKSQELTIEQLVHNYYSVHWRNQNWHEVLRLISGMVDEKWADKIVNFLIHDAYQPLPKDFGNQLPWNILLAINCLKEVQTLNTFIKSAEQLLMTVCSLFDREMTGGTPLFDFLDKRIVPSLEGISSDWPNRIMVAQWLKNRPLNNNDFIMYAELFAKFIKVIGYGVDQVHQEILHYSSSRDVNKQLSSLYALSYAWKDDPATLQIIKDKAKKDPIEIVRDAAIDCLATYFRDYQGTFDLIKDIALKDKVRKVKLWAIRSLARAYRKDSGVLDLLLSYATSSNKELRNASLSALGLYYAKVPNVQKLLWDIAHDQNDFEGHAMIAFPLATSYNTDPKTFEMLRDFLSDRSHFDVRSSACWALGMRYAHDPRTYILLKNVVLHDKNKNVRERTAVALGRYFVRSPELLELMQQVAVNDRVAAIRAVAISALSDRFQEEPQIKAFLYDCAAKDKSPTKNDLKRNRFYPRESAIEAIVKYWPSSPDTLILLQECAKNDPAPWLRARVKKILYELKGK